MKTRVRRRKEMARITATSEVENRKIMRENGETKNWFLDIDKINDRLAGLIQKRNGDGTTLPGAEVSVAAGSSSTGGRPARDQQRFTCSGLGSASELCLHLVPSSVRLSWRHCLDCYVFMLSLGIRSHESSTFVLPQSCFGYSRYFAFPYKFYNQLVIFYKKPAGILSGIVPTL